LLDVDILAAKHCPLKLLRLNGHCSYLAHKRALRFRHPSRTAKIIGEGEGNVFVSPGLRAPAVSGGNELRSVRDPTTLA
jgi:hypothetical protein